MVVYLDNAATSWPKPETVYSTMDDFIRHRGANPGRSGHRMAVEAEKVIEEVRFLLGQMFNGAGPEHVIFTLNCTDALNLALKGLLKPGDHVVTSSIGHNSVVRPLRKLERQGVKVTRLLPSSPEGFVSPKDVDKTITTDTRLVAITHGSNVSGIVQPIEEIGAVARKQNVVFLVDAAQTAGIYPIDVQAANIDLLAFPGHKALLGPTGTGVLYVGERAALDTIKEGSTGVHSENEEQPSELPKKYETGTENTVGIAGLGAGVKYILSEGMEKIRRHEQSLVSALLDGLAQTPGVTVYGPRDRSRRASLVSFNIAGWNPGEVGVLLDQAFDIAVRSGLHCAPAAHKVLGTFPRGTVRISPGYFNTIKDIELVLQALSKVAQSKP